jgi:tetratricopeptide (TPR) repeat protein
MFLLPVSACQRPSSAVKPKIELEEIHILSGKDPELGIDSYDAQVLMEKGAEAFNGGSYVLASKFFQRLLKEYPESPRVPAALFNLGLSLEAAGDMEPARAAYERLISGYGGSPEARDARFRLGNTLIALSRFEDAMGVFEPLTKDKSLSDYDRLEAGVNIGICMFKMGKMDDAEMELIKRMGAYRSISQREYIENNYFMAEAQFYLGEIGRARMEGVKLEFPQEKLEKDLEEKARFLLEAQNQYIRAIRIGNPHWAAASGFSIGMLYETFHTQMLEAPVPEFEDAPSDTDRDDLKNVYREELRKKVSVLISKAINVYERTLDMAQRVGLSSAWVKESSEHLDKLKEFYIKENLQ